MEGVEKKAAVPENVVKSPAAKLSAADIDIQAHEILRLRQELNEILTQHTGKSLKVVEKDTDREFFMTGEQALEYGIIDEIITNRSAATQK